MTSIRVTRSWTGKRGFQRDGSYTRYTCGEELDDWTPAVTGGGLSVIGCFFSLRVAIYLSLFGFFSFSVRRFFEGYLVLYVDTGQGMARRLENAPESPLCMRSLAIYNSMNTSTDLPKNKYIYQV